MTNSNCEICGKPATSWMLRDPFGKSDATRPVCAEHAPQFHNPADVIEITQLRGNLSLAEEGLANYALEVERLRALVGRMLPYVQRWDAASPAETQVQITLEDDAERALVAHAHEPLPVAEPTCAICGEHANEHLAIPHQFMPGGRAEGALRGAGSHYCIDCNEAHDPRTCGALKSGEQS